MIRFRPTLSAALLVCLAVTGCSRTGNEPGEGGVTVGEERQLDAIAERLDARQDQIAPDTRVEVRDAERPR